MSVRWHTLGDVRWDVLDSDGLIQVSNEASLRDGLALRAFCSGWAVATEVSVGEWGRIDVLATDGTETLVIEAKLELLTTRQVRAASNQVSGYLNRLPAGCPSPRPIIVAAKIDEALCSRMTSNVKMDAVTPERLIHHLRVYGSPTEAQSRLGELAGHVGRWAAWAEAQQAAA